MDYKKMRAEAYKKSSLPFSFGYKIRNYFYGEECPICNCVMSNTEFSSNKLTPSIQHNLPITKGGMHELSNISVICRSCNTSIGNNITSDINSSDVIKAWNEMV